MSEHWYCAKTGEPRYTTIGKNGKERSTTLRDAKSAPGTLVPSVSTIIGLLSKTGLDTWKQTEVLYAATEFPRLDGEPEKEWVTRILELAKRKSREAADRGTLIHNFIETHYNGDFIPDRPAYVSMVVQAVEAHFGVQDWIAEKSLVSPEGYGGKCDLYCNGVVIDFKTTEKSPGDLTPYLDNTLQLAAYREILAPGARCANVYINGTTNEVAIYEHDEQDIRDGYEMFLNLLNIYKLKNKLN
jgi:hypothetical protein